MQSKKVKVWSILLSLSLLVGTLAVDPVTSTAEETQTTEATTTETTEPTTEVTTEVTAVTGSVVTATSISLNKKSTTLMAGKSVQLKASGATSDVTWTSGNTKIATVDSKGKVKAKKKGKTTIKATCGEVSATCTVTVVAKMKKKDFNKFNSENFVYYCQRNGYNNGYAWSGQWKGGSKKKTTARGIKIGATKTKVTSAYGELTWKKCTSKDPFSLMKGLKKNKVKTYASVTYGKYSIRFYLNKKSKVVAIIFTCNAKKIKKKYLKSYM